MLVFKHPAHLAFLAVILFTANLSAQRIHLEGDTSLINEKIEKATEMVRSDQHQALEALQEALQSASMANYPGGQWRANFCISDAHLRLQELDKAETAIKESLRISRKNGLNSEYHQSQVSYASILQMQGKNFSGLVRLDSANAFFRKTKDTANIVGVLIVRGNIHLVKGNFAKSLEYFNEALKLSRAIGSHDLLASCYSSVGNFYLYTGEPAKAKAYHREYIAMRKEMNDVTGLAVGYSNLAEAYISTGDLDSAIASLTIAEEAIQEANSPNALAVIEGNLGKIYIFKQEYGKAYKYLSTGAKRVRDNNLELYIPTMLYWLGINYRGLENYPKAAETFLEGMELAEKNRNWQSASSLAFALYQTRYWKKRPEEALEFYIQHSNYKDSITKEEESRIVGEMALELDTQEKEYRIELLEKQAKIDRLRQNRLWTGLGLLLLLALSIIYAMVMRTRKNKKLYEERQRTENEKLKNVELQNRQLTRELDFKKKELASEILHLCQKNELLQNIYGRVESLRQTAENPERKFYLNRLSRMIEGDMKNNSDWDNFLQSFKEVHNDFYDELTTNYTNLTPNDLRLASLMKMNLSSKDIANLLNITEEGVKKARYRLRKKLKLNSEENVQDFLISYA